MFEKAKWIRPKNDYGEAAPVFLREFETEGEIADAVLLITAMGVYEAAINGKRVGNFVMAPGWTDYCTRLQVQTYDVKDLLSLKNALTVTVGKGWYRGRLPGWEVDTYQNEFRNASCGLIAELTVTYKDGHRETVATDEQFRVSESPVRFSEIYDGEIYDASFCPLFSDETEVFDGPKKTLIPQEGEEVHEQERIVPAERFVTPSGEVVFDFGQNLTGFVQICLTAEEGEAVDLSFAEVLDKEGNFYTDNYRGARSQYHYICKEGAQTYHPLFTFYGFRYVRVNAFPGGVKKASGKNFTAVVIHSEMERTGYLVSSDPELNQLFSNVIWGQKGNFVDVPTDCPQRDERLGWTGDAEVFVRTACLNYDAEKFYRKWLRDLAACQHEDGRVSHVVPEVDDRKKPSSAWADAATIVPWEVYLAYGDKEVLSDQFDSMRKWVDYITHTTTEEFLFTGGEHYGDWLGLDAPSGSYKGSSREDLIATAYYAYSTNLVIKAGKVLGKDVADYEVLYRNIVAKFQETYPVYETQTECVLAAHFKLAKDPQKAADKLAKMVKDCGTHLETGFVGTPYLLHVLSDYGYTKLAYDLLLRREFPSWLYPVKKGATTMWEHWDGIMENGDFWSADMNSFNHYAYGCVADWVYGVACGITAKEDAPGYEKVRIAPHPDTRLDFLQARLKTRHGTVVSSWKKEEGRWRYEITTPVEAEIVIAGKRQILPSGSYIFYEAFS